MDVKEMLARDVARAEDKREQVRRDFPWCTAFADQVREAFGPGVKARHFVENGKEMGRPVDEGNVDAFRLLDFMQMSENFKTGKKKGVDKTIRRK